jgi:heme exporter protein B
LVSKSYGWVDAVVALIKKDLIDEYRTRFAVTSIILFALTTLVMVSFSTGAFVLDAGLHAAFLWIIIFFSSMSALARSFIKEEEQGTAKVLKMSTTPEVIFIAKLLFNLILLTGLFVVLYPLYLVLMNPPAAGNNLLVIFILVLGTSCLAGTTTILAAIVSQAGSKYTLLPIIAFPVLLPVLLTAIRGTSLALAGTTFSVVLPDLIFLISFLVIIITVSLLLFPFVWED